MALEKGSLGGWEKHTRAIGSKLMRNMGWVPGGGLGKNGTGRATPVEVHRLAPGTPLDLAIKAQNQAKSSVDSTSSGQSAGHNRSQHGARGEGRGRREYEQGKTMEALQMEIDAVVAHHRSFHLDEPLLAALCADVRRASQCVRQYQLRWKSEIRAMEILRLRQNSCEQSLQHEHRVVEYLAHIVAVLSGAGMLDPEGVVTILERDIIPRDRSLFQRCAMEAFSAFGEVSCEALLQSWQPLQAKDNVARQMRRWKAVMSERTLGHLVDTAMVPQLRRAIAGDWDVEWGTRELLRTLHGLEPLLGRARCDVLVSQLIVPRLRVALEEWKPSGDHSPLHRWLLPIWPVLGDSAACLEVELMYSLKLAMGSWRLDDPALPALVLSLRGFLPRKVVATFLCGVVMPRLIQILEDVLGKIIEPREVEVGDECCDLSWLLWWAPLFSNAQLDSVMEAGYLLPFLPVLRGILVPDANCEKIEKVYQVWAGAIPDRLFESRGAVSRRVEEALRMIDQFLDAGSVS